MMRRNKVVEIMQASRTMGIMRSYKTSHLVPTKYNTVITKEDTGDDRKPLEYACVSKWHNGTVKLGLVFYGPDLSTCILASMLMRKRNKWYDGIL
jgi:hypothetical protein